ncbi:unnamed protein product [Prorocentrum cordatum]|uniref:Uncharacterized protein n=1 Tax=Prorocentrum cordatum TaxID=2364126 RepID=A0ABN9SC76_9DINO|nr:unnamed protein product [Polarella glacialis]
MGAHPTWALRLAAAAAEAPDLLSVDFAEGIPRHGLCACSFHVPMVARSMDRLAHAALYAADRQAFVTEAEIQVIAAALDSIAPKVSDASDIIELCRIWRARAEAGLLLTVNRNWGKLDRKAERPKGSAPSARPTSPPPAHQKLESIALRRLRRLPRSCTESVDTRRRHHAAITDRVNDRQLEHFAQLCLDQLCDPINGMPSCGQMLESVNRAISADHHEVAMGRRRHWAACFSKRAGFDAAGMCAERAPVWSPGENDSGPEVEKWKEWARGVSFLQSDKAKDLVPSRQVSDAIFGWRVAGVPKKDENESRKGVAVVHAVSAWLARVALFGPELDLRKACGCVGRALAAAALAARGAPEGDSVAPGAMVAALVPWKRTPATGWALVDDRSIASMTEAHLAVGLERAVQFDADVGYAEGAAKRQKWSAAVGSNSLVHLGLICDPSRPEAMGAIRSVKLLPGKHLERSLASCLEKLGLEFLGHVLSTATWREFVATLSRGDLQRLSVFARGATQSRSARSFQKLVIVSEKRRIFKLTRSVHSTEWILLAFNPESGREGIVFAAAGDDALGGQRQRDEVANAVVDYLELVCAKNQTKVGWIAERLSNGSLPLEFTGDVLVELCLNIDDPNKLTTADVGANFVGKMYDLDPENTLAALELLSNSTCPPSVPADAWCVLPVSGHRRQPLATVPESGPADAEVEERTEER